MPMLRQPESGPARCSRLKVVFGATDWCGGSSGNQNVPGPELRVPEPRSFSNWPGSSCWTRALSDVWGQVRSRAGPLMCWAGRPA